MIAESWNIAGIVADVAINTMQTNGPAYVQRAIEPIIADVLAHAAAAESALARARNEALEEAATICDQVSMNTDRKWSASYAAAAIRARAKGAT